MSKWRVKLERTRSDWWFAIVEADTREEAQRAADQLNPADIEWDGTLDTTDINVISVQPHEEEMRDGS